MLRERRLRFGLPIALAVGLTAGLGAGFAGSPAAVAAHRSETFFSSPQPGPAILYAPPPRAPQLENAPGSPSN